MSWKLCTSVKRSVDQWFMGVDTSYYSVNWRSGRCVPERAGHVVRHSIHCVKRRWNVLIVSLWRTRLTRNRFKWARMQCTFRDAQMKRLQPAQNNMSRTSRQVLRKWNLRALTLYEILLICTCRIGLTLKLLKAWRLPSLSVNVSMGLLLYIYRNCVSQWKMAKNGGGVCLQCASSD